MLTRVLLFCGVVACVVGNAVGDLSIAAFERRAPWSSANTSEAGHENTTDTSNIQTRIVVASKHEHAKRATVGWCRFDPANIECSPANLPHGAYKTVLFLSHASHSPVAPLG